MHHKSSELLTKYKAHKRSKFLVLVLSTKQMEGLTSNATNIDHLQSRNVMPGYIYVHPLYNHVQPANPQSTKTWRQPQKFSKWEPFLLADIFQCNNSTLPTKLIHKKCKKSPGR